MQTVSGIQDDSPGAVYDDRRIDMLFFKKIMSGLSPKLILSGLAALTLFSSFSSCHIYNLSLEDFLKEWTETARVAESRISPEPVYKDSYAHIASGEDTLITYKLINPQNYNLYQTLSWENGISPVSGTDYYLEQDFNDKNILYLTLKKDFLEGLDGTGAKISPSLTLTEPKSGRTFGTYSVPALVNSAPPEVILPVVLRTDGDAGNETYVICFNLPEMTGIHRDVKTLKIGSPYERTYTVTPEGTLSGGGTELKTTYDTGWKPVTDAQFIGDRNNRFVGIVTDELLSGDLTSFTLSLVDEYGLSTSVTASTRASKLPSVTASPTGGIITINGTVDFSNFVPVATLVLESDNWDGVEKDGTPVSGEIEAVGPITLTFTEPGTYNITAYAQMSGAADSDKKIFTYEVVNDSTVYVSEFGNDNNPGTKEEPVATLQRALDLLNDAGFTEGKIVVTGTVQTEEVKINAPDDTTGSVTTLTVMGGSAGGTLKNENGRVFNIASGGSLTLEGNITLTGTNATGNGGAVYVDGGNFTMKSGSTIANSSVQGTRASGGGVYVMNGTFIMEDGSKITGSSASYGGGVYVAKGTFTMGGGTISENKASGDGASGGGVCISGGTFTMSDGAVISKNTAASSGGGVFVSERGDFTMKGGTIGGPEAESANSAENGGGVYIFEGTFTMSGSAVISGNSADGSGGGVYVGGDSPGSSTFTMRDRAVISGNSATSSGGGVYVYETGNFTMEGGTIGETTAGDGNNADIAGGGVCVYKGTFTMNGGIITGNESGGSGGGVYLDSTGGTVTLNNNSSISGNQAVQNGGGVYVGNGIFTVSDSPEITDNIGYSAANNVYLASGNTITIGDKGLTGATIGVTAGEMESGGATPITDGDVTGADGIFTSDVEGYTIVESSDAVYLSDAETVYVTIDSKYMDTFEAALAAVNATGGTITLLKKIEGTNAVFKDASSQPQPITFTGGTAESPITLDLNGKTIDRGLDAAQANGSVIKIEGGTLTIKDSSATNPEGTDGTGTITGGNSLNAGGGINIENNSSSSLTLESGNISCNSVDSTFGGGVSVGKNCTFTMTGGKIDSNESESSGGGVGVNADGTFTMTGGIIENNNANTTGGGVNIGSYGAFTMKGGTISGNTAAQNGGGVYVSSSGSFGIGTSSPASSPVVSGNTKIGSFPNNVYLDDTILLIVGELKKSVDSGNIGISMATPGGEFTLGWSDSTVPTFFFSDDTKYKVTESVDELSLTPYTP